MAAQLVKLPRLRLRVKDAVPMLVKSSSWYSDPAAPCAVPALTCRSDVAQPFAAPPPPPALVEGDAVTPCGESAAEDAADDAAGEDAGTADDGADDDAGAADVAAGADEDDDPPPEQPAAAVTTAPAATAPASLSNNELVPIVTNHPFPGERQAHRTRRPRAPLPATRLAPLKTLPG